MANISPQGYKIKIHPTNVNPFWITDSEGNPFLVEVNVETVEDAEAGTITYTWYYMDANGDRTDIVTQTISTTATVDELKEEVEGIRTGADGTVYLSAGEAVRAQFDINNTLINGVKDEVEDIRTGADGVTYASAGEAVREQVSEITETLDSVKDEVEGIRTGADGVTYASAGEAVRTQFTAVNTIANENRNELIDARTGVDGTVYDSTGEAIRMQIENTNPNIPVSGDSTSETIKNIYNMLGISPKTASGEIVTINDAAAVPPKSLTAVINAVQDLNGYDKPWAGGAGKNKFNYEDATGTTMVQSDGTFTNTVTDTKTSFNCYVQQYNGSTYVAQNSIGISSTGRKTLNIIVDSPITTLRIKHNGSTQDLGIFYPWTTQGTFIISFDVIGYNPSTVGGLSFNNVMIEEGSTATSYEPYSNICPITGWDEVNVTRCGVNVWDEEWERGRIDFNTGESVSDPNAIRSKNYIPILPSKTYYYYNGASTGMWLFQYDSNKSFIRSTQIESNTTFTTDANTSYLRIKPYDSYGATYNNDISINYPSTDTSYHAYDSTTYTKSLSTTNYGGYWDATEGVIGTTHAVVDLGDLTWIVDSVSGMFRTNTFANYGMLWGSIPLCTQYEGVFSQQYTALTDGQISITNSESLPLLRVYDSTKSGMTATEFKSAVAGVKMLYDLATPTTASTTPEDVTLLQGTNNIWSDSGDTEVEYYPTIQSLIDALS